MDKDALNRDRRASKLWTKQMEKYSQNLKKMTPIAGPFGGPIVERCPMETESQLDSPIGSSMGLSPGIIMGGKVNSNVNAFHHRFAPFHHVADDKEMVMETDIGTLPRLQESKARNPMDYSPHVHFSGPFQEPIAKYHDYVKRSMIDGMKKQEIIDHIMDQAYAQKSKKSDSKETSDPKDPKGSKGSKKGKGWNPLLSSMDPTMNQEADQEADQEAGLEVEVDPGVGQMIEEESGRGAFYPFRQVLPIIRHRGGILCSSDHACTQPHRWSGEGLNYQLNKENPTAVQNWILHSPAMEGVKEAMVNNGSMSIQGQGSYPVNGSVQNVGVMAPSGPMDTLGPNSANGGKSTRMKLGAEYLSLPEGTWMPFKALRKIPRSSRAIYKDIPRVQKDIKGVPRFLKQENNWEGALRYYRMTPQKQTRYGNVKLIGGLLRETAPIFPGE